MCQDIVQLAEKKQVEAHGGFEKHSNIQINSIDIDIYIDKKLLRDIMNYDVLIDARTWNLFGKLRGSLFMDFVRKK